MGEKNDAKREMKRWGLVLLAVVTFGVIRSFF